MATIELDETARIHQVRAHWLYRGEPGGECSWSFWSRRSLGMTPAIMYTAFMANLGPLFNTARPWNWIMDQIRVEDRYPQTQSSHVVNYPFGLSETGEGYGLPPQMTAVLSWRTGEPGRSYRGRTYMGPAARDAAEWENVSGDYNDMVDAFARQMLDEFGPSGTNPFFRFVIVSRQHNNAPDVPGHMTEVNDWLYNFKWAVQRRRADPWWADDPYFSHHVH